MNDAILDLELQPEQKLYDASRGKRLLNYIIDTVIWYILIVGLFIFIMLFSDLFGFYRFGEIILNIIALASYVFYYSFLEYYFKGRTIGKMITKTRAITEHHEMLTFKQAFFRSLCRLIPFEAFSFLASDQGWHDTMTKTKVVDWPKNLL